MSKNLFLLALTAFLTIHSFAQLTGYQEEGFESLTFPPAGWTSQNVAGTNYQWSRSTAQAHNSSASAFIRYETSAAEDWLITPQYTVANASDSLIFYMRLAFSGYSPDSLAIKVSTTTNATASFTTTLLLLQEGVNYPPNATAWYRYAVSLEDYVGQNVYLAFKHVNSDGDGLYVDDVAIGTRPPYNVETYSAATAGVPVVSQPNGVTAVVRNNGNFAETFNVTAEIIPGGYTSTQTVTGVAPGATAPVTFADWVPSASGSYTLKVYTQLASDLDHDDDTLTIATAAYGGFPHYGWESSTALPQGKWGHAAVFTQLCDDADTAYLYIIGGNDAAFAATGNVYRQNLTTLAWEARAAIPQLRQQISAVEIAGKIYVPGGYVGSFSPSNVLQIYDPATDSWTTGATMPTAVGDYAIGTYGDSLMYVIGGYNGSADVTTVQIYSPATNSWTTGTPYTGIAVSGGRMGISGNTIVIAGGYNQSTASSAQALKGVIDPVNPAVITWTALPNMPGGSASRFAGGAGLDDGRIYFTAGDPNGAGTAVLATTLAYNTLTDSWEAGPTKTTGVSNVSNFALAIVNDSIYMVCTGGYNGISVVTANEWLNIGPYVQPGAAGDSTFCDGGTIELQAWGGKTYAWTSVTPVSDPAAAEPTADVTQDETFSVTITPRYGCPVTATVTATVHTSAASSQTVEVCYGETFTVGMSTYSASGTYTDVLQTINGCDSTVTTVLTVLPENTFSQAATICAGDSYQVGTSTYTTSGTYTNVLESASGCDSTVTTELTVLPENTFSQDVTVCSGASYQVGTSTYNTSGTYTDVLESAFGCDSTVTTNLTVLPENTFSQDVTICSGDSYQIGTSTYDTPGTYTDVLTSSFGCDSTVTTNLTVLPAIDNAVSVLNNVITAAQTGAAYAWFDCSDGNVIPGENGQTFSPAANGSYGVYVTMNGCTETSDCAAITTIGVTELAMQLPSIFPNPNNGSFTVQSSEEGAFVLLSELGQIVGHFGLSPANGFSATLSGLDSGVYFITRADLTGARQKVVVTK